MIGRRLARTREGGGAVEGASIANLFPSVCTCFLFVSRVFYLLVFFAQYELLFFFSFFVVVRFSARGGFHRTGTGNGCEENRNGRVRQGGEGEKEKRKCTAEERESTLENGTFWG